MRVSNGCGNEALAEGKYLLALNCPLWVVYLMSVWSFLTILSIQRMPFGWCTLSYSNTRNECLRRKQKQTIRAWVNENAMEMNRDGLKRDRERGRQ